MAAAARQGEILCGDSIQLAYARLARHYDVLFGPLLRPARLAAVDAVNALAGQEVLEVGVGTGLALPRYDKTKRITGIDMSADMLLRAKSRAAKLGLRNVAALQEMDAQAMAFADARFDIAVAMFVASVVPSPRTLLSEMRRVVKPGGTLVFVNHFARIAEGRWHRAADRMSAKLGWRADFRDRDIFAPEDLAAAKRRPVFPLGMFQIVELPR